MENEFADIIMKIREIKSSLIILQQAIQNENKLISLSNIDDNLEIIIENVENTLSKYENLIDKQFTLVNQ